MEECEKERGIIDLIKEGLVFVSQIISEATILRSTQGTDMIMKNFENRLKRTEKKILRNISTIFIIAFGGVLLIISLLFFLVDFFLWSQAAAYFAVGIIILVIGVLLQARWPKR